MFMGSLKMDPLSNPLKEEIDENQGHQYTIRLQSMKKDPQSKSLKEEVKKVVAGQESQIEQEEPQAKALFEKEAYSNIGHLIVKFQVADQPKPKILMCTGQLYFKLSQTKYVVLTVAHAANTSDIDNEGKKVVEMTFQEAIFFVNRDGMKNYKAKFTCKKDDLESQVEKYVAIPEIYHENNETESGVDICLLVVDLVDDEKSQSLEAIKDLGKIPTKIEQLQYCTAEMGEILKKQQFKNEKISIAGYPARVKKENGEGLEQSNYFLREHHDPVCDIVDGCDHQYQVLCHEVFTTSGFAGAPIIAMNNDEGNGKYITIGVHSGYGDLEDGRQFNVGTLINKDLFESFIKPSLERFQKDH